MSVAIQAGNDVQVGLAGLLGISVLYARAGRVLGEMRLGAHHLSASGEVHPGALVGFAEELTTQGCAHYAPAGAKPVTIETKINLLAPCRAGLLAGEAQAIHADRDLVVWQTTIRSAHDRPVAILSHTKRLVPVDGAEAASNTDDRSSLAGPARPAHPAGSVAERRREQIAAAACEVIARKGFANATTREIAEAAGMRVPTMYQYVTSKDEVLELVYVWAMARFSTDVEAAVAGCTTAREKLRATIDATIENGVRYRRQVGVLNRELKSLPPHARHRVIETYERLMGRIADIIAEGIASGEFRPVEAALAANFVDALCDIWPLRPFSVHRFGVEAFRDELATFVDLALRRQ